MMRHILLFITILLGASLGVRGQSSFGEIRGTVFDSKTKQPLDFANVSVEQNGVPRTGTTTDLDGNYEIKALPPGKYTVRVSYVNYATAEVNDVLVRPDAITRVNVNLQETGQTLETVVIKSSYRPPLIKENENGQTRDRETIQKIPTRSVNSIGNTAAGVLSIDGGTPSFRGARPQGTAYFINGVRVIGSINLPQSAIEQTNVITGGVSAEYGDFTGGAISITTPAPSSVTRGGVEIITSSLFDKYHYNLAEGFLSGPILKVREKDRERTILGYSVAGNFNYQADPSPSAIGINKTKDEVLKQLEAQPLRTAPNGQGFVPSAEFITSDQIENVSARLNTPTYQVSGVGNLTWAPTDKINIALGGTYNYFNGIGFSYINSLFNYNQFPKTIQHSMLSYLTFTQNLVKKRDPNDKDAPQGKIRSAYYSVSLQYQSTWQTQQDAVHEDRVFDYGYLGTFQTYRAPTFAFQGKGQFDQPDSFLVDGNWFFAKNYWQQTGYRDTLYTFDRSTTKNPIRSNYTSNFYDFVDGDVRSFSQLRGSNAGLTNGQNPQGIYSLLWTNVGHMAAGYNKSQNEQYSLNAVGEVGLKNHDLKFGIYYEQRVTRSYGVAANGLWQQMWLLSNRGLVLDLENPELVFDENGIFKDTIRFAERFNDNKSVFATRFRDYLIRTGARDNNGNLITQNSYVDVNSYNPAEFNLGMFSADEVLNNGGNSQLVSYRGYDHTGKRLKGRPSLDDFFDDTLNRPIGAFSPIYTAFFIQDKMVFKDLTIRAGLRVERYDANQPELKDPFSLYPIRTAGEVTELNGSPVSHPNAIGNDYAVYVNNVDNPTSITGYRKGIDWYNRNGVRVNDPNQIAELSGGVIQPFLVDPNNQNVSKASFVDYTPQVNVLPRLWLEFPISNTARFFGSYDVIAQRPQNTWATIDDWYFLKFNPTNVMNNPALKPQLTTDYEIGYKQKLSEKSAISLIASYREQRNLIQLFRYNFAFPVTYISYANIDFATIKGFRVEYELRDAGNLNLDANYTLQFADGTGASAGSQAALVQAGQPNLRTLFPLGDLDVRHNIKLNIFYDYKSGDQYDGPVWFGKKVFQNAGIGLTLNAFSGLPFTANAIATPTAQSGQVVRSPIRGTPFGSRLPWQLQNDINIYKGYPVKLGRDKDGRYKYGTLRFMFWVQNFLDIKNIRRVHSFTGSPDDDGWLNSPNGQEAINAALNAQSFVDLYNTALQNPGFYGLPRRIRLSTRLVF